MPIGPIRYLPEKLRLTATLLGCTSQKDLCAAFRRINPNTDFDLERSYKWMQGRAVPRSSGVFEDWVALLGCQEQGLSWILTSDLDEFAQVLGRVHKTTPKRLMEQARLLDGLAEGTADNYLCGIYATYSYAQSPYYRGQIVRGTLLIEPAARRSDGMVAIFSQSIAIGRAMASGTVGLYSRVITLELRSPSPGVTPVFGSFIRPSPPASVTMGVFCSSVAVDPGGQPPYATRMIIVRSAVSTVSELERSNRYFKFDAEELLRDLAGIKLFIAADAPTDNAFVSTLQRMAQDRNWAQIDMDEYRQLAALFDPDWLKSSA